jgi:RNA methyltransferase, TrmH family
LTIDHPQLIIVKPLFINNLSMLTSLQNPLIKQLKKLSQSKERKKQNLFLLEGTNLIESACQIDYPLLTVCCTEKWAQTYHFLYQKLLVISEKVELVTPEVLEAIATTVTPDGVVATAARRGTNLPFNPNLRLGLVLERLQDPGNLGTIIRCSVATGVDNLWLSNGSVELDNPKVLRASVGQWFRLQMGVSHNLTELINTYKTQQQVQVIATLPQAIKTYWEIDLTKPTLILFGNESAGLSQELISLADEFVTIPLHNGVESLNVGIAASLLLYESERQRKFTLNK